MTRPQLDIKEQLAKFIQRHSDRRMPRTEWLADYYMKAYVRLNNRYLLGVIKTSLDIAAVEVEEQYRRQGRFKDFLLYAHDINPRQVTYIECVNNPDLQNYLRKDNWIEIEDVLCFYKLKN